MAEQSGNEPMHEYLLTTVDNPWDPWEQWEQWYSYDAMMGYHTPSLLARLTITSDELSDLDQEIAIQDAIEDIVTENVMGVHRKIKRGDFAKMNEAQT